MFIVVHFIGTPFRWTLYGRIIKSVGKCSTLLSAEKSMGRLTENLYKISRIFVQIPQNASCACNAHMVERFQITNSGSSFEFSGDG
jgi:hypothetical protein